MRLSFLVYSFALSWIAGNILVIQQLQGNSPTQSLEFKGFYKLPGEGFRFDVSNKETQYRKWLKVGQRTGDFKLSNYEKQDKTHTLYFKDHKGEITTIELSESRYEGPSLSSENEYDSKELRFRNGLYYIMDSKTPATGKVVKKYPNDGLWYERGYKDGKKHGVTKEWFINDQQKYEMFYEDNKRTGTWTYWDQNGKVTAKREYENNQFKRNLPLN
jgi:hypothetical protein